MNGSIIMSNKEIKLASPFTVQPGEVFLTTAEYEARYSVSKATQCRQRKDGTGPPFVVQGGKILYPESAILSHFNFKLVRSTAEVDPNRYGGRYEHLASAREKALESKRRKVNESAQQTSA